MSSQGEFHSYAALKPGADLVEFNYKPLPLGDDQIEVEIDACGVCHSDLHQKDNDWGLSNYPLVPGHEIIGKIVDKGRKISEFDVAQRVGVGPQIGSCKECEVCRLGKESLCTKQIQCYNSKTNNQDQPYTFGGFSDRIRCPAEWAFAIPDRLETVNAAPLLCAGLTTWAPFIRHGLKRGDVVGIIGVGGLGHIAIQFANALGYETTAISTSVSKKDEATRLGAHQFLNINDAEEVKAQVGTFDFLLATISANIDWTLYLTLLKPEGKLCLVGLPTKAEFNPLQLVMKQLTFVGSILSPKSEIGRMLKFAADHNIQAITEVLPMSTKNCNEAMSRLAKNMVRYRMVLVKQQGEQ